MKKTLHKLSITKKFQFAIVFSVVLVMVILTSLMVRHESLLTREYFRQNAEILATSISIALNDNMLGGRPEETLRLMDEMVDLEGVEELAVMKPDGSYAFGRPGPQMQLDPTLRAKLNNGESATLSRNRSAYLLKPLLNSARCRSCHPPAERIRGIVLVGMSSVGMQQYLVGLVGRMSWFALFATVFLSAIMAFLSKRMLFSPINGLTEATRQIAFGNYVACKPRGADCHKILGCEKTECPSYENRAMPCWLQSGTLCSSSPTGLFALKSGDCVKCRVYQEMKGDELTQLQDNFNMMSLSLRKNEEEACRHIRLIEDLNQGLTRSNAKLTTLLDASRLTTSSLELDHTLAASLRIILDVTSLQAGIILLLDEDLSRKCHEFFSCEAYNCPAYRAGINCWRLSGTMCHGEPSSCPNGRMPEECWGGNKTHSHLVPAKDKGEKLAACTYCDYFANIVLIPKMTSGFSSGHLGQRLKIDSAALHKALLMGQAFVNYSGENPFNIPINTSTELAIPLRVNEQLMGIFYLAADSTLRYSLEEIEFFQFLTDVISAGIFNSQLFEEIEVSYLQTVMALSNAIEAKDPYTHGHSQRVADLSVKAAKALNLSKQETEHIRFAAILHDVGKISISGELLKKNGKLSESEHTELRIHPERGVQILEPIHFLKPVLPAILHHHERFDGSGYPLGLKAKAIPLKARIISVADAWDAMRSDRPYRKALSVEEAKDEVLRHAGIQFDPEVTAYFINSM
jgi:GAF domain-containing protein/HD superfamily phosphohydrolase YqeK